MMSTSALARRALGGLSLVLVACAAHETRAPNAPAFVGVAGAVEPHVLREGARRAGQLLAENVVASSEREPVPTRLDAPASAGARAPAGDAASPPPAKAESESAGLRRRRAIEALDRASEILTIRDDARGKTIVLESDDLFEPGGWTLRDRDLKLDETAEVLHEIADATILIEGHTDALGDAATNVELSQRRAEAVRDYLVAHGVDGGHLRAEGLGDRRPIATNKLASGRAQNRRIEIVIARP